MKKYIPVFGPQELFERMPDDVTHITSEMVGYRIDSNFFVRSPSSKSDGNTFTQLNGYLIAERRIIKEPKHWTWEDKKAGRLPEVGCVVMAIGVNEVARIAAINNDSVCSVCVVFEDGGFITLHFSGIAPIETPAEKAARLRDEWCSECTSKYYPRGHKGFPEMIYDALLSGELKAPESTE